MKSIYHRLLIKAEPANVYDTLTTQQGLAGWWTPNTIAKPETGTVSRFEFGGGYFKEMKITNLEKDRKVEWVCEKGFEDWVGTTLTFELHSHEKGTVLTLMHAGWKEYTKDFASCSYDWAMFLRSLRLLNEDGLGRPWPDFQ